MSARISGPFRSLYMRSTVPKASASSSNTQEHNSSTPVQPVLASSHPTTTDTASSHACTCASAGAALLSEGRYCECLRFTADCFARIIAQAHTSRSTNTKQQRGPLAFIYQERPQPQRPQSSPPAYAIICSLLHSSVRSLLALGCNREARHLMRLWEHYRTAHGVPATTENDICHGCGDSLNTLVHATWDAAFHIDSVTASAHEGYSADVAYLTTNMAAAPHACQHAVVLYKAQHARHTRRRKLIANAPAHVADTASATGVSSKNADNSDQWRCDVASATLAEERAMAQLKPLLMDLCVRTVHAASGMAIALPEASHSLNTIIRWLHEEIPRANQDNSLPAGTWCLWQLCQAELMYQQETNQGCHGSPSRRRHTDTKFQKTMQHLSMAARDVQIRVSAKDPKFTHRSTDSDGRLADLAALSKSLPTSPLVAAILRARDAAATATSTKREDTSEAHASATATVVPRARTTTTITHSPQCNRHHTRADLLTDAMQLALASFTLSVRESLAQRRLLSTVQLHLDECVVVAAMMARDSQREVSRGDGRADQYSDQASSCSATAIRLLLPRVRATLTLLHGLTLLTQQQQSFGCLRFRTQENLCSVGRQLADGLLTTLTDAVAGMYAQLDNSSIASTSSPADAARLVPVWAEWISQLREARALMANAARRPACEAAADLHAALVWRLLSSTARQDFWQARKIAHTPVDDAGDSGQTPQRPEEKARGMDFLAPFFNEVNTLSEATARSLLSSDVHRTVACVLAYADCSRQERSCLESKSDERAVARVTAAAFLRSFLCALETTAWSSAHTARLATQDSATRLLNYASGPAVKLGAPLQEGVYVVDMMAMLRAALAHMLLSDMCLHSLLDTATSTLRRVNDRQADSTRVAAEIMVLCKAVLEEPAEGNETNRAPPAIVARSSLLSPLPTARTGIFTAWEARVIAHQTLAKLSDSVPLLSQQPRRQPHQAITHLRLALLTRRRWLGEVHEDVAASYVDLGQALLRGFVGHSATQPSQHQQQQHMNSLRKHAREAHACAAAAMGILTALARQYCTACPAAGGGEGSGASAEMVRVLARSTVYEQASVLLAQAIRFAKSGEDL